MGGWAARKEETRRIPGKIREGFKRGCLSSCPWVAPARNGESRQPACPVVEGQCGCPWGALGVSDAA